MYSVFLLLVFCLSPAFANEQIKSKILNTTLQTAEPKILNTTLQTAGPKILNTTLRTSTAEPKILNITLRASTAEPKILNATLQASIAEPKILKTVLQTSTTESPPGCVCGIFLSGQFKKSSKEQPTGNPALIHDQPGIFPCTPGGNRICTNKCLDTIIKYLPNSSTILCGSIDRDCYKERAYLFIKNCKPEWINTNLSAGREYCCKDGAPYKCPIY